MVHHIQNNMQPLISMLSTIFNSMESTLNRMLSVKKRKKRKWCHFIGKQNTNICSFVKRKRITNVNIHLWVVKINVYFVLYVLEIPLIFPFIMLKLLKLLNK